MFGIFDQRDEGGAELAQIVRRDRGRHADRDAARAIGQQIGEGRRQHHRLFVFAVIGGAEIDRVLVQPVEQRLRDFGQAAFGVAHGGGVIAVDIAEIALPVDQRIAHREILRQAHQRVIDRLIAMGMERAHHIADHLGGFLEARQSGSSRSSRMPYRMRRCTGFSPSRTSGSARWVMVDSA